MPLLQAQCSYSAHLDHALQSYKCFALHIVDPLSVLFTVFYSARLPNELNDVLREPAGKSFSASRHPWRALPGLLLRAVLMGDWAAGVKSGGDGRGLSRI
jgi:hypothetical protein